MTMAEGNLSLAEAAQRLGVSPHTLRNWAKYKKRVAYLKFGRRIVFSPRDLAAFEDHCRVDARVSDVNGHDL